LGYDTIKHNLAESSIQDAVFKDLKLNLNDLVLCYGHHVGKPELRALIAEEYEGIADEDVLLTAGAASALFIVSTSLLSAHDHLIVVRPNYATNIETPRAIGCEIDFVDLSFDEQFALDIVNIKSLIKANTKLISVTTPHNPTGVMLSEDTLKQLVRIAEAANCILLVDETYRDLSFIKTPVLAAPLSENVISVSSVSKAYGLPGIRLGWLITKNKKLQELFLAAKEQLFLCNSVVDEEIAYQFLQQKNSFWPVIQQKNKTKFEIVKKWMDEHPFLEWIEPQSGVVCFPRLKKELSVDTDLLYTKLYNEYQTLVGPGHWFEMDKRYMRIGYGWPDETSLALGLAAISNAIRESLK
jgi:aspartate/methionine/tyrosine aminotransferase